MNEHTLEEVMKMKGLTAPRITPIAIDELIASINYFVDGPTLTICVLTLQNGFKVVGYSACASPENFDPQIGQTLAYEHARNQIWPLAGYALMERLIHE
jgi:hypothetical protein